MAACDTQLESGFRSMLCSQLTVDCTLVVTECVKGQGLPPQMGRVHFLPLQVRRCEACSQEYNIWTDRAVGVCLTAPPARGNAGCLCVGPI
jgi:hypothetical protein